MLYTFVANPYLMMAVQVLDGITGAIVTVLVILVITATIPLPQSRAAAKPFRQRRGGRLKRNEIDELYLPSY